MSETTKFDVEQEGRIVGLNLATALHKDTFKLHRDELRDIGEAVVRDAALFAAFVMDGTIPPSDSGESAGATTAVDA